MPTVDIYCRTATQEQGTPIALRAQERACRAYSAEHGLTIGLAMYEIAPGTGYKGRPVFDLIRRRWRNHLISGVVVIRLDRITRVPDYLFELLQELEQYHITLHCANEDLESSLLIRFFRMSQ